MKQPLQKKAIKQLVQKKPMKELVQEKAMKHPSRAGLKQSTMEKIVQSKTMKQSSKTVHKKSDKIRIEIKKKKKKQRIIMIDHASEIPELCITRKHLSITSLRRICRRSGVKHMEGNITEYLKYLVEQQLDLLTHHSLLFMKSSSTTNYSGRKTVNKDDVKKSLQIMKNPIYG